jgi:Uma2 family endonuclease
MAEAAIEQAGYNDLLQVPEPLIAELMNGEIHTHPRPASRHARASSMLGGKLVGPFDQGSGGPGGWWIIDEPELHLGLQVMVPDLAGWRRRHMPEYPDAPWFDLAPDWVCEVLSPSTAQTDRSIKMPIYAIHRVAHLWLIDPILRTLEGYQLTDDKWLLLTTLKDDDPVRLAPFEATEFPLSVLWP